MPRLFYDTRDGSILTPSGRVIDTAETLDEAAINYPWPFVFMTCDGRSDFDRVLRVAEPDIHFIAASHGINI